MGRRVPAHSRIPRLRFYARRWWLPTVWWDAAVKHALGPDSRTEQTV